MGHTVLVCDDAIFIAHARTDVPSLCAEVRRLQAICREAHFRVTANDKLNALAELDKATDPEKSALK